MGTAGNECNPEHLRDACPHESYSRAMIMEVGFCNEKTL